MELLLAITIGILTAGGFFLLLRKNIFSLLIGLGLLSYAVNLFLFAMGRLAINAAPIIGRSEFYSDPLPQALVLTAIVIGFAMSAFVVVLALRTHNLWRNDHTDTNDDDSGGNSSGGKNTQSTKNIGNDNDATAIEPRV